MSQFFRKKEEQKIKISNKKTISLEEIRLKISGKSYNLPPSELKIDGVGSNGLDRESKKVSKSYNLFSAVKENNPTIVASENDSPLGFDKFDQIGKILINRNDGSVFRVKTNYGLDENTKEVINSSSSVSLSDSFVNFIAKSWYLRSMPSGTWRSVAYGNNLFVAVSDSGTSNQRVATSPDGVTWTIRSGGTTYAWKCITYANNRFVALAPGRAMVSTDGFSWQEYAVSNNNWSSITYGNGIFVAVANSGDSSRVLTSSDGITWSSFAPPAANSWNSVTFGNNRFVAVSSDGSNRVMYSFDGFSWNLSSASFASSWSAVTYGEDKFVALASSSTGSGNRVMYSEDGINWTNGTFQYLGSRSSIIDGSDGALVVNSGQTVDLPGGSVKKYSSINIASGGTLRITGNSGSWTEIGCSGNCVINGTIIAKAGYSNQSTHSTATFSKISNFGIGNISYSISQSEGADGTSASTSDVGSSGIPGSQSQGIGGGGAGRGGYKKTSRCGVFRCRTSHDYYPGGDGGNGGSNGAGGGGGAGGSGGDFGAGSSNSGINGGTGASGGGGTASYGSAGGAGGGYKGAHGKGVHLYVEGLISGNGTIDCSGSNGFAGGVASGGGGDGGGGAGGSGGQIIIYYTQGNISSLNLNVSGGAGGSGGNNILVRRISSGLTTSINIGKGLDGYQGTSRIIYNDVNNIPPNNAWSSVVYAAGYFIAVASSGEGQRICFSQDGVVWFINDTFYQNSWTSVAYGNGVFAAVSSSVTGSSFRAMSTVRG
jgi:hypothetical protein